MTAPPGQSAADTGSLPSSKPIHSLVLDTGPLIKNDPPVSVLLAKAEKLYTVPVILSEIRDAATRSRVETTLLPFVTVRSPKPESLKFVAGFAKKTGDHAVLSKPDLEVLALGYELECERNGGDWRLRSTPGQARLNGKPPAPAAQERVENDGQDGDVMQADDAETFLESEMQKLGLDDSTNEKEEAVEELQISTEETLGLEEAKEDVAIDPTEQPVTAPGGDNNNDDEDDDDDEEGWITPSNLKKQQTKDAGSSGTKQAQQRTLQAAVLTSDYAMQNVALRMNLNLVAPSLARITYLKNWMLRCHGCFAVCKDMAKQFCPRCGQPTLTRVSCSTDTSGNFRVHLKKDFQWNNRGNVYSVPKPVHGSSNGRLPKNAGGGKNGWGTNLILAEDQKEHVRQQDELRRQRNKDLMDDDFLPGLLGEDRRGGAGKIRVGAGRNVNSRRKR